FTVPNCLDSFEDRFGLKNHSFTAAKWAVINRAVAIGREVPQIMDSNFNEPLLTTSPNDAKIEWTFKELGENRDDVKNHLFKSRRSSGKSTSIRRRSRSIPFKYE